jgi:chromosome segregation ATPase
MQQIIAEIEEGKWFVSMECLFSGFDYSVMGEDGKAKVVARTEESSFLTKHLRAYGGTGEYEGYKIGRSLRDISFSGKGLVSKPANPRSVILDASKAFSTNDSNFTQVSQGEVNMSDTNVLEKQLAEVQNELASAKEENKAIRAQIEAAKDKEYADTISSLEGDVTAKADEITALTEKLAATGEAVKTLEETIAAKDAEMMKKEEEMKKMKKMQRDQKRMASLVEVGFDADEAEESIALYDVLEDEAFDSIVAMYDKKMKKMAKDKMPKDNKMEEGKMDKKYADVDASDAVEDSNAEEEVSEELFDGVKSTEATLIDASDDTDELQATRASVAEWLENNILNK